jgi:hypothetical protein
MMSALIFQIDERKIMHVYLQNMAKFYALLNLCDKVFIIPFFQLFCTFKFFHMSWALVAHICNPRYLGR